LEFDGLKREITSAGIKCSMDKLLNFLDEKVCVSFIKQLRNPYLCADMRKHIVQNSVMLIENGKYKHACFHNTVACFTRQTTFFKSVDVVSVIEQFAVLPGSCEFKPSSYYICVRPML
jgi:hypothetical protein